MMRYLTSILSLGSSKKISTLEKKVKELEAKNREIEGNISEIAVCIQHLAASMTTVVLTGASTRQQEDPFDTLMEDKDDDKGYLH